MPKPLLVNINGMRGIGVTVACDRVARCLNGMGINTVVVSLKTGRECVEFTDNIVMGKYAGVDVVLFDKHFYTESAARRMMRSPLWCFDFDADALPHLSLLLSPKHSKKDRHKYYLDMLPAHFGTDNHHVITVDDKAYAKLYAAGTIKQLILREWGRDHE